MPLFPLAAAVVVLMDGRRVSSYNATFIAGGHVYAPVRPYVTRLADRMWFERDRLVIVRDGRRVNVRATSRQPDALDRVYVPLAAVARTLGATVTYRAGIIDVRTTEHAPLSTPAPFAGETVPARAVFTPEPQVTPRPVWSGEPLPRRTPLPFPTPLRKDSAAVSELGGRAAQTGRSSAW